MKQNKQKKLILQDLAVDSFETRLPVTEQRGTVHGHATELYTCDDYSCWWTNGPNINCWCNYTDGACTWGAQETCAHYSPPCPV
jgi:hypothetical protein